MNDSLEELFAAVARRRVLLLATAPLALAACGGGGGNGDSGDGAYYAVEGTRSAGGVPVTICLDGAKYVDPSSAAGVQLSANLAKYYGLVGGYRTQAGTGQSCREHYASLDAMLTVDDYNRTVLPALATGSPPPASPPSSPPAAPPTPPSPPPPPPPTAPAPIACASTHGTGLDGLRLTGTTSYSGLSSAASDSGTVTFAPGPIAFQNPNFTPTSTTGSLRARLWASNSSFSGGTLSGYVIATYAITFTNGTNQLMNNQTATLAAHLLDARTPPRGSYCLVTTLEEYQATCSASDHYCLADWSQFTPSQAFQ